MRILAIDPGNIDTGWCIIDPAELVPLQFGKTNNEEFLEQILCGDLDYEFVVIEMIASYGMAVGAEVFATCVWIGRYLQANESVGCPVTLTFRREVKLHHCGTARAKDANITQALVDRFAPGQPNHGKGTKARPGFFYGFHADVWAAYALAVQHADQAKGVAHTPMEVIHNPSTKSGSFGRTVAPDGELA